MSSILRKIKLTLSRINDPVIRERLLMVQEAYQKPLRDVAVKFGYTHGKVAYWKNRYREYGLKGLKTKQRSGRPKKLTSEQERRIRRKVRKHNPKQGWRTTYIRSLIRKETGITYSYRQVIRIAQTWGLSRITPRSRYAYSKKDDREVFIKKTNSS